MSRMFAVERQHLHRVQWLDQERLPLSDGQVRLHVDSFALTANNITYAAFGDAMHYWDFFPTGQPATGCIPVWGFATVSESRTPGVNVGERWYGYWPMADEAVLQPSRIEPNGFTEGAAHRRTLQVIYNHYLRCRTDPLYRADQEPEQALLRPLFTTSFLIDDFLADNAFFGAEQVLLSSASSKTAYGTAFCLSRRRSTPGAIEVIGLTSRANIPFTERLGCYDGVIPYDALPSLAADRPTIYVDMSGSTSTRAAVHHHFGSAMRYSCSVGGTHWQELGSGRGLPGPPPVLFFAPEQARKRREDWGRNALESRIGQAWAAFMVCVTDPQAPWLRVVRRSGPEGVEQAYRDLLDGRVSAQDGIVLSV